MKFNYRFFLSVAVLCISIAAMAQSPREDFRKDINISGALYRAYPGPQKQLSAAPAGYTPYYISHYGRHGSRYLIGKNDYEDPYKTLKAAAKAGALNEKGMDVFKKVEEIRSEAKGRLGELTPLGAEQHKQIAKRMYERFPEVFEGKTNIDAKSTIVIRCILSMENEMQQFLVMNPYLHITHDASYHDMNYMNQDDSLLWSWKGKGADTEEYKNFCAKHSITDRVAKLLFKDTKYLADNKINGEELVRQLFHLAQNIQSTELRHKFNLWDLFNEDEVYDMWSSSNAWWYIAYGNSPLSGGQQCFSQRNLLRKIISEADSCLALPHPGATLRFGHDTMVLPLTCLLNINGNGISVDLDEAEKKGWANYKIAPMATNIQFIFYHKNDQDKDPIFKVLHCEDEAVLPDLKPVQGHYYKWSDFKAFFLKKLDDYEATRK